MERIEWRELPCVQMHYGICAVVCDSMSREMGTHIIYHHIMPDIRLVQPASLATILSFSNLICYNFIIIVCTYVFQVIVLRCKLSTHWQTQGLPYDTTSPTHYKNIKQQPSGRSSTLTEPALSDLSDER